MNILIRTWGLIENDRLEGEWVFKDREYSREELVKEYPINRLLKEDVRNVEGKQLTKEQVINFYYDVEDD